MCGFDGGGGGEEPAKKQPKLDLLTTQKKLMPLFSYDEMPASILKKCIDE